MWSDVILKRWTIPDISTYLTYCTERFSYIDRFWQKIHLCRLKCFVRIGYGFVRTAIHLHEPVSNSVALNEAVKDGDVTTPANVFVSTTPAGRAKQPYVHYCPIVVVRYGYWVSDQSQGILYGHEAATCFLKENFISVTF